jgi:hypothetical protein
VGGRKGPSIRSQNGEDPPDREKPPGEFMDTREAILNFQYSEKMKSGLIIGKKVLIWYLEGLLREVRIAENVFGGGHYMDLERKLMEVIGRVQMSQFQEIQQSLSEAISLATTSCQASMNFLIEKKLV